MIDEINFIFLRKIGIRKVISPGLLLVKVGMDVFRLLKHIRERLLWF